MKQGYSILTRIEVSNPGLQDVENNKKENLPQNQMLGSIVPFVKEYVEMIKVRMFDKYGVRIYHKCIRYNFQHLIYFKPDDKYLYLQSNEDYDTDHVVMMIEATNCAHMKKE